jgi:hypothetical protein
VILTVGTVENLKGRRGRRGVGRLGMTRMKRTSQRRAGTSQTEEDDDTGIVLNRMKEETSARKTDEAQEDLVEKPEFPLAIDEIDHGAVVTSQTITIGIDISDTTAMITTLHTDGDAIEAVLHLLDTRAGNGLKPLQNPTVMLQRMVHTSYPHQHPRMTEKLNFVANLKLNTGQGTTLNNTRLIAALVAAAAAPPQVPIRINVVGYLSNHPPPCPAQLAL